MSRTTDQSWERHERRVEIETAAAGETIGRDSGGQTAVAIP